jgi:hypothetical protein
MATGDAPPRRGFSYVRDTHSGYTARSERQGGPDKCASQERSQRTSDVFSGSDMTVKDIARGRKFGDRHRHRERD